MKAANVLSTLAPAGPVLQRKCACGQHTIAGGQCESCRKQGLTVGEPGGELERAAEDTAARVMGVPGPSGSAGDSTPVPDVTPDVEGSIRGMSGQGARLPAAVRNFFEPRFGHDFSQVRVHSGDAAASVSAKLDAEAFTFGQDIFFNQGRYNPSRPGGRHLLAHELAHVVQQNTGAVARQQLQRASIPYRTLKWSDFQKAAPANPAFDAETSSGFSALPAWSGTPTLTPTGNDCTLPNRRPAREMEATITKPASAFDALKAEMVQGQSWVVTRYKDSKAYCAGPKAAECQKSFDDQAKGAATACDGLKKDCEDAFKKDPDIASYTTDDPPMVANSAAECTTIAKGCRENLAKSFEFSLDDPQDTKATSKKDCSGKVFQAACLANEKVENAYLLKHEQGHFDISNVMAIKAKKALQAKAAAGEFKATETECGNKRAANAAAKAADELSKARFDDWTDKLNSAQEDYDTETDHSRDKAKQATWDTNIAGGLTAYDLNAPVVAPTAPGASPAPATAPTQAPTAPTANPGAAPRAGQNKLQRKCACGQTANGGGECEECRKKREPALQRNSAGPRGQDIPPVVYETLQATGTPIEPQTRRFMESRFGYDFSNVRVHADSPSAPAVNALAYTVGSNIVFAPNRYAPGQIEGRRLLAHELAHVIQQSRGVRGAGIDPDPALERDADQAASKVSGGGLANGVRRIHEQ